MQCILLCDLGCIHGSISFGNAKEALLSGLAARWPKGSSVIRTSLALVW